MTKEKKNLLAWIKEVLRRTDDVGRMTDNTEGVEEVAKKVIGKATGEAVEDSDKDKESCSYALKRNIVTSLQEIRKFAEEHDLAASMIKALLTLLAEMAINALRGKVSATVLSLLLNALNYDKSREMAYREGEIAGRNAQIVERHFPADDDGVPLFTGADIPVEEKKDIFSIAREG